MLIEGSADISSKWNRHRTELKFGSHRNKKLQKDWKEAGEDKFLFSILSELKVEDDENFNVHNELKILMEMVEEERNIEENLKY